MSTLVLLRHGQSTWNELNLFTGWVDVELSPKGEAEAAQAGVLLREAGVMPTVLHTSLLRRAIKTANLALESAELSWLPVKRSWRLNERHYGALQGLDKAETREKHGDEQLKLWRRSYDVPPPPIEAGSKWDNASDPRYSFPGIVPRTECLKDVVTRMLPYWFDAIVPDLQRGETVLVVAHGNSLRALVKHLDGISDDDIAELNIPTGVPLVYTLDESLQRKDSQYLGDAEEIAARAAAVAAQAGGK